MQNINVMITNLLFYNKELESVTPVKHTAIKDKKIASGKEY